MLKAGSIMDHFARPLLSLGDYKVSSEIGLLIENISED